MISYRTILAIGAHPDDIEYGCFGFLLRHKDECKIHLYVASLGSVGDPTSGIERRDESSESFKKLSPSSVKFREKTGISDQDFNSVLEEVTGLIQTLKPDLILCLGPHDSHQEHRKLFDITIAAARRSRASILSYGIVSNTLEFRPQYFVDISEVYEQKKEALLCHQSQKHRTYMSEEYLDIFHSNNYASLHGVRYCEAYEVVRLFS
jgi:LmbE family N-acetylglucosaminyl deacetylase